jgi:hypothetical protein
MSNKKETAVQVINKWATGSEMQLTDEGLRFDNFEDVWRFAQLVKRTSMVPPNVTVDEIMISVTKGRELGFPPLQSVTAIPVVKGRPTLEGKAMLALVQSRGVDDGRGPIDCGCSGEGDDRVGWCESWRSSWPKARRTEFSWKQAVTAGLTKPRGGHPSIYAKYGEDMLQWKAVARHCNKYYSDLTHGMMLEMTAREVYDNTRDITPEVVEELPLKAPAPDPLLLPEPVVEVLEPVTEEPESDVILCGAELDSGSPCPCPLGHEWDCNTGEVFTEEPEADEAGSSFEGVEICGIQDCMQEPKHAGNCDWDGPDEGPL